MKTVLAERISASNFARFGSIARLTGQPATAAGATFSYWSDLARYHVAGETEIGVCTVFAQPEPGTNWMERHDQTPEILLPIDAPFLLPVMSNDGSAEVAVFEVQPGEAVVIGAGVWHSACLPLGADQATYWVLFRRGTPAEDVVKTDIPAVRIAHHPR